jgi:seryl-tRNA synthetase
MMMTELLRENKRMLDKSIREIERERQGLQAQEKKLIAEIKKVAKQGQMVCSPKLTNPTLCMLSYSIIFKKKMYSPCSFT